MNQLGLWSLALPFVALGCGDDSGEAVTTSGPRPSPADALVAALGGQNNLDAIQGLRLVGSGERHIVNEGERPADEPIDANTFERSVSIDFRADALRIDTSREILFQFPGPQEYSDIIQGTVGVSTEPFFGRPLGALNPDKAASIRRQEVLVTPHLLLREFTSAAFVAGEDVTLDGAAHHTLVASGGPSPLTLFVDAESGLITKLQTLEHDFSSAT